MEIVPDLFLDVDPNWDSSQSASHLSKSIQQITIYGINQPPPESDASLPSGPCPFLNSESPDSPSKSGTKSDICGNGDGNTRSRKVLDEVQPIPGYNYLLDEALELADRVEQSMPTQESSSYSEVSEEFRFATSEQPESMSLEPNDLQQMPAMPERTVSEKKESHKEYIPVSPIVPTNVMQPTIANMVSSRPPKNSFPFYINTLEEQQPQKVLEVPMSPCTPDTIGGHSAPILAASGGRRRSPVPNGPDELPELSLTETFQSRQDRLDALNEKSTPSSATTPATSQLHSLMENANSALDVSSSASGSTSQPATSSRDYGSCPQIESVFGQKLSKSVPDTYKDQNRCSFPFRIGVSTAQEERTECSLPSPGLAQESSAQENDAPQNAECADRFLSVLLSNPNMGLEAANVLRPCTISLSSNVDKSQGKKKPVRTETAATRCIRSHRPPKKRMSKREAARIAVQRERKRDATLRQMVKDKAITDDQLLQLKPKKKRRAAKFEKPRASRFCHVCSRTPKSVRLVTCANIQTGTCRKVVCIKCFDTFELGDFEAVEKGKEEWPCTHCTNQCPERAQCKTYQRTNDKLRLKRLKQEKKVVVKKRKNAHTEKRESGKRTKISPNVNGVDEDEY